METKMIGNFEITKCTAVAITAGDSEADRQEAIMERNLDVPYEYSVAFGVKFDEIETEDDLANIDTWSFEQEDLDTILID